MMRCRSLLTLFTAAVAALPRQHPPAWPYPIQCASNASTLSLPLTPHPVYYFPGSTHQIEALFPRYNGQFLLSSAIPGRLYLLDPFTSQPPILLHEFPGGSKTDLLGLAELEQDIFYTATVNLSKSDNATSLELGSNTVWKIDMNDFEADAAGRVISPPTITELVLVKEAGVLNGLTSVYSTTAPPPDFFLAADSLLGVVWKISSTGEYTVAANETTMKPPKNGTEFFGINGLKVQGGYLYYTNSGTVEMWRIPIQDNGIVLATAQAEFVARVEGDDFVIDAAAKYAYVAGTLTTNAVFRVDIETAEVQVLGGIFNSTKSPLVEPTAVQFGRTKSDWRSIYVTTDGGHGSQPVPGTQGVTRFDVDDCALPWIF